jgi:hypothetical protein
LRHLLGKGNDGAVTLDSGSQSKTDTFKDSLER